MSSGNERILVKLKEREEQLYLSNVAFGEHEGKFLGEHLMKEGNNHIRSLVFTGATFDSEGAKSVGELLAKSSRMEGVSFGGFLMLRSTEGLLSICAALKSKNTCLRRI